MLIPFCFDSEEVIMARAYSLDLRQRVVDAIEGGLSTREAARQFSIGIATAGAWHRLWRRTGDVRPGRQGQPEHSKLDAHEDFILGLVEEIKDIALAEIAERLVEERGVSACPATIWYFFDKRGITFKKRQRMRASSSAPM
jgi:transposase